LAVAVTSLVHGRDEATRAEAAATVLFTDGVPTLDAATLESALADAPTTHVARSELEQGLDLVEALVRCGLAGSKTDARRLLSQGSVYINGRRADPEATLTGADVLHGRWIQLRRGKQTQHVLVVVD
jgi:tyrosyl-tRNA synthetase